MSKTDRRKPFKISNALEGGLLTKLVFLQVIDCFIYLDNLDVAVW